MKRSICALLVLLLLAGCRQKTISPAAENHVIVAGTQAPTASPAQTTHQATATPTAAATSRPTLPTYPPKADQGPLFPEELLSQDGEPLSFQVYALITNGAVYRQAFYDRFADIVTQAGDLDTALMALADKGRTLTASRKESSAAALAELMSEEVLASLAEEYSALPGEGEELPLVEYRAAIDRLLHDLRVMEDRTAPFFILDGKSTADYRTVLSRYMGETVDPWDMLSALEALAQTEAFALYTATQADPEVVRKKEPISLGGFTENLSLLRSITQEMCPLPDGSSLPMSVGRGSEQDMDLLQLAFRYYPGMTFLRSYAAHSSSEQQARWANAPDGYLAGLAIHGSYAVIPYLKGFAREYVQYHWYEEMLYVTLTGISALLIHYYGYSEAELSAYLTSWGADSVTSYLYEKAMFDPFESLVAAYGYSQYLDMCQAALDAGCENELRFYRDYLAAGPAPLGELKEYMVSLYQKQG